MHQSLHEICFWTCCSQIFHSTYDKITYFSEKLGVVRNKKSVNTQIYTVMIILELISKDLILIMFCLLSWKLTELYLGFGTDRNWNNQTLFVRIDRQYYLGSWFKVWYWSGISLIVQWLKLILEIISFLEYNRELL